MLLVPNWSITSIGRMDKLKTYRYLDDYASDDLANLTSKDALQKVSGVKVASLFADEA